MQVSFFEPAQVEYVRQLVRAYPELEDQPADIYQVLASGGQRHELCDASPLDSARAAYGATNSTTRSAPAAAKSLPTKAPQACTQHGRPNPPGRSECGTLQQSVRFSSACPVVNTPGFDRRSVQYSMMRCTCRRRLATNWSHGGVRKRRCSGPARGWRRREPASTPRQSRSCTSLRLNRRSELLHVLTDDEVRSCRARAPVRSDKTENF
jgi:hypothetical protein